MLLGHLFLKGMKKPRGDSGLGAELGQPAAIRPIVAKRASEAGGWPSGGR